MLKAVIFGSVIGMLSPYFYLASLLALQALMPIKNLELEQAAWGHDLVYGYTLLPGLAAIAMLFMAVIGGLIGWGFAKLVVRTRRPTIAA